MDKIPYIFHTISRPNASARLLCFHHAGGSAAQFKIWMDGGYFSEAFEVLAIDLPGRGRHADLEPFTRMGDLISDMASALAPILDEKPYAFFGHSLGAMVAFELALERQRQGKTLPFHIILSARSPPSVTPKSELHKIIDDDSFIEAMAKTYKNPDLLVTMSIPKFRASGLRLMRADMSVYGTYYEEEHKEKVNCSVAAYVGSDDLANTHTDAKMWRSYTTGAFSTLLFNGGHFYYMNDPQTFVRRLSVEIEMKMSMGQL